jgi:hypothetical protein
VTTLFFKAVSIFFFFCGHDLCDARNEVLLMKKYLKKKSCLLAFFMILCIGMVPTYHVHAGKSKAKLVLNHSKVTLVSGKTVQLKIKNKLGQSGKVKWTTSRKAVASVTAKGKVRAKSVGKARITATLKGTGRKASCTVTVKAASTTSAKATSTPVPSAETGAVSVPETSLPQVSAAVATEVPTETTPTSVPTATTSPHVVVLPTVTSAPGEVPVVTEAPEPQDVDSSILVAATHLVTVDGELMTAYIINKKFSGDIHISVNDHTYTYTGTSGRTLLSTLTKWSTTKTNSDGSIRVSRNSDAEDWLIEDFTNDKAYYLRAVKDNDIDATVLDCGIIYIKGDVQSEISIY